MNGLKAGWKSSEFWQTAAVQLLAFLVLLGVVPAADKDSLGQNLSAAIVGVATVIGAVVSVLRYINSRTDLKIGPDFLYDDENDDDPDGGEQLPVPPTGASGGPPLKIAGLFLACLGCLLFAGTASAEPPRVAVTETSIFPWRDGVERRLEQQQKQQNDALVAQMQAMQQQNAAMLQAMMTLFISLQQKQQAPAQPQIIYLSPPRQEIPLGGLPRQDIPLGGLPKQDVPLGGPPKQDVPLGGLPRQDLPLGGQPKQQIDPGKPAPQTLPLGGLPPSPGEAKPLPANPLMPPAPTAVQRFTPALWRP